MSRCLAELQAPRSPLSPPRRLRLRPAARTKGRAALQALAEQGSTGESSVNARGAGVAERMRGRAPGRARRRSRQGPRCGGSTGEGRRGEGSGATQTPPTSGSRRRTPTIANLGVERVAYAHHLLAREASSPRWRRRAGAARPAPKGGTMPPAQTGVRGRGRGGVLGRGEQGKPRRSRAQQQQQGKGGGRSSLRGHTRPHTLRRRAVASAVRRAT